MAQSDQPRAQLGLEVDGGVIGGDGDAHGGHHSHSQ